MDNLTKLEEQGHQCISNFKNIATKFYSDLLEYLNHWTETQTNTSFHLNWILLNSQPAWTNIQTTNEKIIFLNKNINENELFDEAVNLKAFVTTLKLNKWTENSTAVDKRWVEIF
jgi:hypothetical protein